jgi:hypothetical protein
MLLKATLLGQHMRDDFDTLFSAGLLQAAHGVVAIFIVSILPR